MNWIKKVHRVVGWRAWGWLAGSLVFSFASSGIELLLAYFIAHLLYLLKISGNDAAAPFFLPLLFQTTGGSLLFLLLIGPVRTLFRVQASQSVVLFGELVHLRLRFTFFRYLYDPRSRQIAQSDINTWLGEIFPKATAFATAMGNFLSAFLQACFFFAVLLWMSPLKATVGFAALLILGPAVRISNRYVKRLSQDVIGHFTEVQQGIVRATRNWILIRVLRTESLELGRLQQASLSTTQKSLRIQLVNGLSAGLPEMVGVVVAAILIGLQYGPDRGPATTFVAFLYLFMRFSQCLAQIGTQAGALHASYPGFERSADFLLKIPEKDVQPAILALRRLSFFGRSHTENFRRGEFHPAGGNSIHAAPAIAFKNVSFSYGEATVIKNLSFETPAGSAFGIVGPSGAGKSTLLALLMGLEIPDQGQLRFIVGGAEFSPLNHQLTIGYVGPEPFLVAGSVEDNLLYGSQGTPSPGAMIEALKKAGFSENHAELKALLDSQLTEGGEGLSTGQKQRLCLARALLSNPALLILDEVSANLDAAAEATIAKTVEALQGQSTIVIVSHRDAMLRPCDQVLNLTSGQLTVRA